MTDHALILSLSERLWIVSTLLTRAASRAGWDTDEVQELVERLQEELNGHSILGIVERPAMAEKAIGSDAAGRISMPIVL